MINDTLYEYISQRLQNLTQKYILFLLFQKKIDKRRKIFDEWIIDSYSSHVCSYVTCNDF